MPLLRFNILEGRTDAEIEKLLDAAHAAVVAAFHVTDRDRYQLVSEYRPGRMIALDLFEDHVGRMGLVDFLGGFGKSILLFFQLGRRKLE